MPPAKGSSFASNRSTVSNRLQYLRPEIARRRQEWERNCTSDTFLYMNIEEKNQAAAIKKAGKLGTPRSRQRPHAGRRSHRLEAHRESAQGCKYKGDVVESFTTDVKVIARAAAIWRRIGFDDGRDCRHVIVLKKRCDNLFSSTNLNGW
jgi:hypothetical protein